MKYFNIDSSGLDAPVEDGGVVSVYVRDADISVTAPTSLSNGEAFTLVVDRIGSGEFSFPSTPTKYAGGSAPVLPEASGSRVVIGFAKADGALYEVSRSVYDAGA